MIGFTGSSIWHLVAMFPPVPPQMVERGYADFAERFNPILDVFDEEGVRFAHEVHPSEIAYDYWTTVATLDAIGRRPAFGLNFDPSHFIWQDLDPVGFLWDFQDRIYHVDCKESKRQLNGRNGRLSSHLPWGDPRRGWDFVSTGHGDVPWEAIIRMLNAIGYDGPISIEWEDAGMDRLIGAPEALELIRRLSKISPPEPLFDAAFSSQSDVAPPPAERRGRKGATQSASVPFAPLALAWAMRFAFKTAPQHTTWADMLAVWRAGDEIELFESAWNFDHFYPIGVIRRGRAWRRGLP